MAFGKEEMPVTDKERESLDLFDFDLQPVPKQRSYAPSVKRDTSAADVTDGTSKEAPASSGFRIPPAGRDPAASRGIRTAKYSGASFNNRKPAPRPHSQPESDTVIREYAAKGPFIRRVTVKSWPSGYNFYEKFVKDAVISHGKTGEAAPHVPFFSYIPQYSQLTSAQWAYYLYMKSSVKAGACLKDADFSYVLLYIYEIINLEGVIPPSVGASLLGRIWVMYRRIHPMLDKYMSEWMADYCLVYGVELPKFLRPILAELTARSSIREFFADEAMTDEGFAPGPMIRLSLSDYTPARSRYASKIDDFVTRTEEVFDAVILEQWKVGEGIFAPKLRKRATVTRDAFCGSLCASNIKKKITLELETPFRAPDARRVVTEMMKGAENIVRGRLGIKARLTAPLLTGRSAVVSAATEEEREYLSFYESPSEPLTMDRAAEIENDSWRNTEILTEDAGFDDGDFEEVEGALSFDGAAEDTAEPEDEITETASSIMKDSEESNDSLAALLEKTDKRLLDALTCAVNGGSFASFCREAGMFADDVASRINDAAMDIIGDVVLEGSGTDYTFIEDYRDDID